MKNEKMQHAMSHAVFLGVYLIVVFYIAAYFITKFPTYSIEKTSVIMMALALMVLVGPVAVYYFQKKFRDEKSGGYITYSSAFSYGFFLFFYASLILGVGQFILYQFIIEPQQIVDSLKELINKLVQEMGQTNSYAKDIIENNTTGTIESPITIAINGIVNNSFWGVIISAITAAIVKRTDNRTNSING